MLMSALFMWSQLRFITNYFYVFSNFQPEVWQSDAPDIMKWLQKNSNGRKIYFFDHQFAPLFYAFYTQMDPIIYQNDARWSIPNEYGWTHVDAIGSIISNDQIDNIWLHICKSNKSPEHSELLVVQSRNDWSNAADYTIKDFTGVHTLRQVYDSNKLYDYLRSTNYSEINSKCRGLQ